MPADRCTSDANRHEREAMRSSAGTRMAVSGPEAAKQRGTRMGLCTQDRPVAVQLAAACLHASGQMHERRQKNSCPHACLHASGQMHERRQKNSCPHCRQLFSRKALCYISESAVSSAFTMLFTAVRSALTEARMISTSTPAPQYSTPLFLLLTPT